MGCTRFFRQFWLLFCKNCLVMWRSKVWTIFEILVPCVILLLFMSPTFLSSETSEETAAEPANSIPPKSSHLFAHDSVVIAFSARKEFRPAAKVLMNKMYSANFAQPRRSRGRYSQNGRSPNPPNPYTQNAHDQLQQFPPTLHYRGNRENLLAYLKQNLKDRKEMYRSGHSGGALVTDVVIGVHFKKLDLAKKELSYTIFFESGTASMEDNNWKESGIYESLERNNKTVHVQWLIDSAFLQSVPQSIVVPQLEITQLPVPRHQTDDIVYVLIIMLPIILGFSAMLPLMHTTRELANETQNVKDFLSVMGLSTTVFYCSHMFMSFLKCVFIFVLFLIPLLLKATFISSSLLVLTVIIYSMGVVVFAALIAVIFKKPTVAFKVALFLWTFMIGVTHVLRVSIFELVVDDNSLSTSNLLLSLNINGALAMTVFAMLNAIQRNHLLTWGQIFDDTEFYMPVGYGLAMMLVDILWMLAVMILLIVVKSTNMSLSKFMWKLRKQTAPETADKSIRDAIEVDTGLEGKPADIEVDSVVKIFGGMTEPVVNGVSIKAYSKQVSVLLGHNGAGKSTVFSMISGMVKPTSGEIKICQEEVTGKSCRSHVGYCPQGNPLFDKLTVADHLWLIHGLKGATGNYKEEGKRLLETLEMSDKWKTKSAKLSGGMKRKLCVCMAMIGESSVILLDEPTAGMDPGARRDVEKLLQEEKKTRTFLLTTHYMDEAETLGDRIFILSKGHVICSGSTEFLKKRFGSGYILTVVFGEGGNAAESMTKLLHLTKDFIPDATAGETHGKQLEIILPKDQQDKFPLLFAALEKSGPDMGVNSFGLSLNTLEQVFLKVLDLAHPISPEELAETKERNTELIQSQGDDRRTGLALVFAQILAVFHKKGLYILRHWMQLVLQLVLPICVIAFLVYLLKSAPTTVTRCGVSIIARPISHEVFGSARVVLLHDQTPVSKQYLGLLKDWSGTTVIEKSSADDLNQLVWGIPHILPPVSLGAVFGANKIKVLYSLAAYHARPLAFNLVTNALLRQADGKGSIETGLVAYADPKCESYEAFNEGSLGLIAFLLLFVLSLVTSNLSVFLVEERRSKFAHQQSLTGISPSVFWISSFIFDVLFSLVVLGVITGYLAFFTWPSEYLVGVVVFSLAYVWSCIPFVYAGSFLFSSSTKANLLFVIWQTVFALIAFVIKLLATIILNKTNIPVVTHSKLLPLRCVLAFFLPSFALLDSLCFFGLAKIDLVPYPQQSIFSMENNGIYLVMMCLFGLVASVMFVVFQLKSAKFCVFRTCSRRHADSENEEKEDEDVTNERKRVEKLSTDGKLALDVQGLSKWYGKFRAVNHLTLGVENNECFALLGVNGAGKTTTFDILTGQSFPTSGTAMIDQKTVTERVALGYCPQFDAVMMEFTGKETLTILARMYGFRNCGRKVDLVLQAVGLEEHKNKLVKHYSGGQRRKLSVGLALLAQTRIVILDEPTAGVDPKARRDIWELLSAVRDTSSAAILLTSHSMEECEALCSRIAILNKGRMVAVGTSQQLKSKYGNSYNLILVLSEESDRNAVKAAVTETFPNAELTTNSESLSSTIKWKIPKQPGDLWSAKFSTCMDLARSLKVADMCLAQSSLEDAFLILSKQQHDAETDEKPKNGKITDVKPKDDAVSEGKPQNNKVSNVIQGDVVSEVKQKDDVVSDVKQDDVSDVKQEDASDVTASQQSEGQMSKAKENNTQSENGPQ